MKSRSELNLGVEAAKYQHESLQKHIRSQQAGALEQVSMPVNGIRCRKESLLF